MFRANDVIEPNDLPANVAAALERAATNFGDAEALVEGDTRISWRELLQRTDVAARALIGFGIQPGDRISIWAPNLAEWVYAACAIHRVGAVLVPLNTRFKRTEAAHILSTAGVRLVFTVSDFLDINYVELLGDTSDLPSIEGVVNMRGEAAGAESWSQFLQRAESVPADAAQKRAAQISPDDLSDILFTSGTTGLPKGAMLTHHASIKAFWAWSSVIGLNANDRYLVVNPFFHSFGLKSGILSAILKGSTLVPLPVFDVPSAMRKIQDERISMIPGPPTIYQSILDHPDRSSYDLSSLRLAVTGAAVVPVELVLRMRNELKFDVVVTGYGLTEATGIATMCRHTDDPETIAHTSGRAIPDVEVIVADDNGNEVPAGEPGEVLIRGYNVMKGFFQNPEATASAIDTDGWLHTGDIGVMDEGGNLRITDRMKDMFIVGGFNAYPAEIENIMLNNQLLSQAAVVGVPDERMGEVGAAFVIPRPGAEIDPAELITWCRNAMANYKVPRHVFVVESFPLNASGKVLKYQLRDDALKRLS